MRESRTYGFVRGVLGDQHPYRDSQPFWFELSPRVSSCADRFRHTASLLNAIQTGWARVV
jgi:hypothetical protein